MYMSTREFVQVFIPKLDSPEKVYELFLGLGYPRDKILDPTYKRKISELELAKEEREKVKNIYTIFNYDGNLQIFLIEATTLSTPLVRYLAKNFSDKYLRFLLILTVDYKEFTFLFPEFERKEVGKHKLKITRLILDRSNPYHTDLFTISSLALKGDEENWKDIWKRWRDAFSVEKVTDRFFEDYKKAFFRLRETFQQQKIPIKHAHELSQQFLNRLMFLYFISKKRWLNDDPKFIKWYWERYREERRTSNAREDTFYENWLRVLFLEAFNNKYSHPYYHPQDVKNILALAPYLNGGLFHRNDLDDLPFEICDGLFEEVFDFLEKYNFTIREDLPLDAEVAVDPQMIGYVYESLSNVAEEIYERQDLGIFYTPTVEVDFMCRRSLVEYLTNHLNPPNPPLEKGGEGGFDLHKEMIYRLLFDEDKKDVDAYITRNNLWYRLEETLDNLAVVDPACGSGAFLVGMLHILSELYRLTYGHIKREMTEFELKKKIIGSTLYGVDVMPWAVHSAELRLWLQLIIEEDIPYEQRKLFPLLPNLNLRLRIGDSLVQEVGGVNLHVRDSKLSPSIKKRLTSLKAEKEKYYNNDPTGKFKSAEGLLQEELRIFGEILDEKIVSLQKEIQALKGEKRKIQIEMFDVGANGRSPSLFEEQIKAKGQEIEHLLETKRKIQLPGQKPFVWDIDFAEIFGDKGGFDIVIGNPPYVRQEKIAPPNKLKAEVTLEDKRGYKEKLLSSIQVHYPFIKKLDKKSDYYIYFYFHGLSLLNDKGTFCFITSNSWLDVGYGADLQEFLLKYCPIKAVYDNEAKRSFEHADVNTIIAIFGPPDVGRVQGTWPALEETARFVMFKRPFEEVVNVKNLLEIEMADAIRKTDTYRVYPVKQEMLLDDGWEYPEETQKSEEKDVIARSRATKQSQSLLKDKFLTGKYEGNKWGGKYLRAPDIFYTILEKGNDKLTAIQPHIGKVITVAWSRKGLNSEILIPKSEGYSAKYETLPVLKSPREIEKIIFGENDTDTLLILIEGIRRELKHAKLLWVDIRGDRHLCHYNTHNLYFTHNFHGIVPKDDSISTILCGLLNSTLTAFFVEVLGRKGLGGGAVRLLVEDLRRAEIIVAPSLLQKKQRSKIEELIDSELGKRRINSVFEELRINPTRPIREQTPNPLPDRKALHDIVFDILGLTQEERNEVYWAVCELVKNRLEKARSV